jgi:hypothetical protein
MSMALSCVATASSFPSGLIAERYTHVWHGNSSASAQVKPEPDVVNLLFAKRILGCASHAGHIPEAELSSCMAYGIQTPVRTDMNAPAAHAQVERCLHSSLL